MKDRLHPSIIILPMVGAMLLGLTYLVAKNNYAESLEAEKTLEASVSETAMAQIGNEDIPPAPPGVMAYKSGIGRCSATAAMTSKGPKVFTAWHCFQGIGSGNTLNITLPGIEEVKVDDKRLLIGDILAVPYSNADNLDLTPVCEGELQMGDWVQSWTFPGSAMESTAPDAERILYYSDGFMIDGSTTGAPATNIKVSKGSSGGGVLKKENGHLCWGGVISSVDLCSDEPCVTIELIPQIMK